MDVRRYHRRLFLSVIFRQEHLNLQALGHCYENTGKLNLKAIITGLLAILLTACASDTTEKNTAIAEKNTPASTELELYPVLKEYDWRAKNYVVYKNFRGIDQAPFPIVTYGYDEQDMHRFLTKQEATKTPEAIDEIAMGNLCKREVKIETVFDHLLTASGDGYSSEMMLCDGFIKKVQEKLETDNILIAVPRRTTIYIAKKDMSETDSLFFYFLIKETYADDSYGNAPISNAIFEFKDGEVVAVSHLSAEETN